MGRILTLSGPSGVGKTMLAGLLAKRIPNAVMVTSYTTRSARASDLLGEYNHVSATKYGAMVARGEFLWQAKHGSAHYGTRVEDIDDALSGLGRIGIMILVPDKVPALRDHLTTRDALEVHVPVYIVVSYEDVLMHRLIRRGDALPEIERRLAEARPWEAAAVASGIPYTFVRNDGPIEAAYQHVVALF